MAERFRIVILTALEAERRSICRAIGMRPDVEVFCIGLRAVHLPAEISADLVIVAGLAGGLNPVLKIGDIVLSGAPSLSSNSQTPWRHGSIHTAAELVSSPERKTELFRQTNALVVDMEHSVIQSELGKRIPVIGLRVVSDTSDMAVNPAVVGMIDSKGRPRPLAVLSTIVRNPRIISELRTLQANSKIALHNLGRAISGLLDRFPPKAGVAYAPADSI